MNLTQAMNFIHCTDWKGSRLGLTRMTELMHRLGDPQKAVSFLHVAGSNGKGSVSVMLASILTAAGYRTGLYTSPHLSRVNERMKLDGRDCSDGDLIRMAERVKAAVDGMEDQPTEFELITAMAFCFFQEKACDLVVLEVGLGGRLDATNVIPPPEAAVITNIALEHTEVLGDTLEKIAAEKAGIIKPGASVVLYHQDEAVERVVRQRCRMCGVTLQITDPAQQIQISEDLTGQRLSYRGRTDLRLSLRGTYQYKNAAVVLDTVDLLRSKGYAIAETAVAEGLACARWPGRFEVLRNEPLVLVDGAHNRNGAEELAGCLRHYLSNRKVTFVMGVMEDKDYMGMLREIVPLAKRFITVTPDSHRALPSEKLRDVIAAQWDVPVTDAGSVRAGMELALRECTKTDGICAFGTLYQVGEIREMFQP